MILRECVVRSTISALPRAAVMKRHNNDDLIWISFLAFEDKIFRLNRTHSNLKLEGYLDPCRDILQTCHPIRIRDRYSGNIVSGTSECSEAENTHTIFSSAIIVDDGRRCKSLFLHKLAPTAFDESDFTVEILAVKVGCVAAQVVCCHQLHSRNISGGAVNKGYKVLGVDDFLFSS
jgi:hypothetical protein